MEHGGDLTFLVGEHQLSCQLVRSPSQPSLALGSILVSARTATGILIAQLPTDIGGRLTFSNIPSGLVKLRGIAVKDGKHYTARATVEVTVDSRVDVQLTHPDDSDSRWQIEE